MKVEEQLLRTGEGFRRKGKAGNRSRKETALVNSVKSYIIWL